MFILPCVRRRSQQSSPRAGKRLRTCLFLLPALCSLAPASAQQDDCNETVSSVRIDLVERHPWRPPFGLEAVGAPISFNIEVKSQQRLLREYYLVGYVLGEEVERKVLNIMRRTFGRKASEEERFGGVAGTAFERHPDEVALYSVCRFQGEPAELARKTVPLPKIQAAATARSATLTNPVDLGTIFVPQDWLLLAKGQKTEVEAAAIAFGQGSPKSQAVAWFDSNPASKVSVPLAVDDRKPARAKLALDPISPESKNDVLHVAIVDQRGVELWRQDTKIMYVAEPPKLPAFGATELILRYDPPISVNTAGGGKLEFLDYDAAWRPELKDVVVTLPDGGRFVFWRGSNYIPFWAGEHNTALCYEWAETTPPPDGFVDSIEPLMDKELRYGRVEILESTSARVHVRWTYQSTDFTYKVWGDQAYEDFYFYPDGFGTRVLNLKRNPETKYEVSEFIVLTPQSAYPLDVLPKNMVDILSLDGSKQEIMFPEHALQKGTFPDAAFVTSEKPSMYRIRMHKNQRKTAVYFYPNAPDYPMGPFGPFYDRGQLVTPAYWGSHWPLSRGKTTGWSIDDRIHYSPAHNSLLAWGVDQTPPPMRRSTFTTINTLGEARTMYVDQWSWLIGMTDISDVELLQWAQSFSRPPSVEVSGAELDFESYVPERRAIRLLVKDRVVLATLSPNQHTVNPVFELVGAPEGPVEVLLDGQALPSDRYAWDGKTLWIEASLSKPSRFELRLATGR